MGPVLVLPMLYVAYFFPARYAWPLAVLEVATYASPFLTSDGPYHLLGARTLGYAVAYAGLVATIQFLKRRLVIAERQQHRIARIDPLTGLQNRRGFDEALSRALEDGIASRCSWPTSTPSSRSTTASATRPATASCVSWPRTPRPRSAPATAWRGSAATSWRWSPRAPASEAAVRLAESLRKAGARVDAGDGPVSLTVSWAVYPEHGSDRFTLMRALDRELHAIKDARKLSRSRS